MSERSSGAPVQPEQQRGLFDRFMAAEANILKNAVHGPAGRWLAAAATLLTLQGCGTLRSGVNEYRSNVETRIHAGLSPASQTTPRVDRHIPNTPEGRHYADRFEVPTREESAQYVNQGTITGVDVTLTERTRAGRLREAAMGHPELLQPGDQLLVRAGEETFLDTGHLEGRWWRGELEFNHVYAGLDGRDYVVIALETLPLDHILDRTERPRSRRDIFAPHAERHSIQDRGMAQIEELAEGILGSEAQVVYRHEDDAPATRRGISTPEWHSRVAYYLVRTRAHRS